METNTKPGSRIVFIGLCVVLMAVAAYLAGKSLQHKEPVPLLISNVSQEPLKPLGMKQEGEVFRLSEEALQIGKQPTGPKGVRTLTQFYERRAYPGAPPFIPHEIKMDMAEEGVSCLACHDKGGYVTAFQAYAPVTPHPEFLNCRQCHLPVNAKELFKESDWKSVAPPLLGQAAIAGGPLPIPHPLQMRGNCLACHGGAAAIKDIRSGHPERVNCRQCHVPYQPDLFF